MKWIGFAIKIKLSRVISVFRDTKMVDTNSACLGSPDGKEHGGCENVKDKQCEEHASNRVPSAWKPGGHLVMESDAKVVIIIVDEFANRHCCQGREIARMNDIYAAHVRRGNLKNRHMHFVRFNPDEFKIGGKAENVSMKIRYATLVNVVRFALAPSPSEENRPWSMCYLYYDCDENGRLCIMDEMNEHTHRLVHAPIYGDGGD